MDVKKNSKNGFTLIELMVVIVIIGILVAIALPNFIAAQDRAKIASVKSNIHMMQTCTETYAIDNAGVYPDIIGITTATTANKNNLAKDAFSKNYWKEPKNPFSSKTGINFAYVDLLALPNMGDVTTFLPQSEGVILFGTSNSGVAGAKTSYVIYGAGRYTISTNKPDLVTDKGSNIFSLSNS